MKKERSPAQKLGWYKRALREVWNRSPMKWEAYNRAKVRPAVLKCEKCAKTDNAKLFEIDHIEPVQDPLTGPSDVAEWARRLNCPSSGLQALCESCHQTKSNEENSKRRKARIK